MYEVAKATGPLYAVHFRRRREQKTDYNKRLALLKSGRPRLIVRKTNRYIQVQLAQFNLSGDAVIVNVSSKKLAEFGFPGKNNTPSAYLTGLLAGKIALGKGAKEFVLDIGRHSPTTGSVVFAAAKGAIDAGLKAEYSEEKYPSEERIAGKHISDDLQKSFGQAKEKIMK